MIDTNRSGPNVGRYLFMPFETSSAGVQRIDLSNPNYATRTVTIVAPGTQSFAFGDASRWAPWGGYLTAEESWGTGSSKGRLFEITDPVTAPANGANFLHRNIIPRVAHEGLAFDHARSLYFVDEFNGGGIYKFVSVNPNANTGNDYFAAGQTFVLKVGLGGQSEGNNGPALGGASVWTPITDANGAALPGTFAAMVVAAGVSSLDGRAARAFVGGTGFNRPEDLEIQTSGATQRLYFAATDADSNGNPADGNSRVYNINLTTGELKLFADGTTIDLATGLPVGAALRNADNLAIDQAGNVYIVEDRPGGIDGDIWFARDLNKDGDLLDPGEGLARWASNGATGSELTGLHFDFNDPTKAYVNVMHPASGIDRTLLISAVPEPQNYAMLLAGFVVLIGVTQRRRAGRRHPRPV